MVENLTEGLREGKRGGKGSIERVGSANVDGCCSV